MDGPRCKLTAALLANLMVTFRPLYSPRTVLTLAVLAAGLTIVGAVPLPAPSATPLERLPEEVFAVILGPDMKAGYNLRSDTWNGNLPAGETKPIHHQFFKGNDYHFYVSTDVRGAKMSLHIYDQDGNLAEDRSWQKQTSDAFFAGAEIRAKSTGSYFLILRVDESPEKRTAWNMAYAYK